MIPVVWSGTVARPCKGFGYLVYFLITAGSVFSCDRRSGLDHRVVTIPEAGAPTGQVPPGGGSPAAVPLPSARPSTAQAGSIAFNLQSSLPDVLIELSQEIDHVQKKPATLTTWTAQGGAVVDDHIPITLRYRGTSSYKYYPKKQYAITVKDKNYQDAGLGLVDFPGGRDYVLYAPYGDKSLVRNVLAYNLYNKMGHYDPRTRFVTLSVKDTAGNTQKMGVYVLMEKIRVAPARVAIGRATQGVPSSYLLRFDRLKQRAFVTTDHDHDVVVDYPGEKQFDAVRKKELTDYLNAFESRLFSAVKTEFLAATDYVDLPSLVDFIIMQELARNIDAYNYSVYFYLPAGGRLTFGPVWDMDIAYGNVDLYQAWMTNGFQLQQENDNNWFKKLLSHPVVKQALIDRYTELRGNVLSEKNIMGIIDEQSGVLPQNIVAENFSIWNILGVKVWPNYQAEASYAEEIGALKSWLRGRLAWLDSSLASL